MKGKDGAHGMDMGLAPARQCGESKEEMHSLVHGERCAPCHEHLCDALP